jgi:hypothetical protein
MTVIHHRTGRKTAMTTMATEARPLQVGDRVRWTGYLATAGSTRHPEHIGAEGTVTRTTGSNPDDILVVSGVPDAIASGWGQGRWALVEADPNVETHLGFRMGQRVRTSYGLGTVIPHPPEIAANARMRQQYVVIQQDTATGGYYGQGRYVIPPRDITPLDEPDVTAAPTPITVGATVQIANPAYSGPDGGYVDQNFYGARGVVDRGPNSAGQGSWYIRLPGYGGNHIHENYLTVVSGGSDESAAADTDDDGQARVGDHVRNPSFGEGRVIRLTNDAPGRSFGYRGTAGATAYQGIVQVQFASTDTEIYTSDLELVRRDDSPIPEPGANYGPGFEPGVRVWVSGFGLGTVVEKTLAAGVNARHIRHAGWSRVQFDSGSTQMVTTASLALRPDEDSASLTDAEKLDRLQRMIHRVASYEAVRREWCDEVNTALAHLDGLLPTELQRVNRELGRYLRDHPREIFRLDTGPTVDTTSDDDDDDDEPEDVDWTATVTVDYASDEGFTVTGATVRVSFSAPEYHDNPADYIDDSAVESAIDDSDLPAIARTSDIIRWSVDDVEQD